MRRAGPALWLLMVLVQGIPAITIDADAARTHAEALRNTYPRPEGSAGEVEAIAYIRSVLDQLPVDYTVRDFSDVERGHSYSAILDVSIPGNSPDVFLVFAPLGHPDDVGPDEDRSASLAAALAFAEAVSRETGSLGYRIVMVGAEFGDLDWYPLGTRLFLQDYFPERLAAAIYLDANSPGLVFETGGGGEIAPAWLLRTVLEASRTFNSVPQVRSGFNQLHRLGFSSANPSLEAILRAGIPAVYAWSEPNQFGPSPVAESAASLAEMLGRTAETLNREIPSEWDRHYLFLSVGRTIISIPEYVYLLILVAVIFATLLYSLVARQQLGRYLRTIARNFWNIPVLFILIFLFLTAGTLLLNLFLVLRRFPTLWQQSPISYVGLKLALSVLLFALAAQFLRLLPLSKNGSFYSAASLFVLFVDIILASLLNLSVSAYFLWAFLLSFLFSVLKHRIPKLVALVVAPVPLIAVSVEILSRPELRFAETLLLSPTGNLVLSFVILPFLLMLIRLDFLIRHPVAGRRSFALRLVTIASAAVSLGLLMFIVLRPSFTPSNPQPVEIVERVDYESFSRNLVVHSIAPLGDFSLNHPRFDESVSTGRRTWERSIEQVPDVLSLRLSTADFLDRNQARLIIDSPQPLEDIRILFTAESAMTIYDMDLPYRLSPDRVSAEVFVGKRPPLPLMINYTTDRFTTPRIEVIARSPQLPDPVSFEKPLTRVFTTLEIRTVLNP